MQITLPRTRGAWVLLLAGPLVFLAAIVGAAVVVGIQQRGDAQAIAARTPLALPYILVVVQLVLLALLVVALRREGLTWRDIGWRLNPGQRLWREALVGAAPGVVLAVLYVTVLSPLLETLQRTLGDYVPPGELTPALGAALVPFFIANVVLAPFVEESLYRGYALDRLARRYGAPLAAIITCIFFGLLHWAGGIWYIVLTGLVAGGLFAGLRVWRGNLVAPFAAHLALNLLEFLWIVAR